MEGPVELLSHRLVQVSDDSLQVGFGTFDVLALSFRIVDPGPKRLIVLDGIVVNGSQVVNPAFQSGPFGGRLGDGSDVPGLFLRLEAGQTVGLPEPVYLIINLLAQTSDIGVLTLIHRLQGGQAVIGRVHIGQKRPLARGFLFTDLHESGQGFLTGGTFFYRQGQGLVIVLNRLPSRFHPGRLVSPFTLHRSQTALGGPDLILGRACDLIKACQGLFQGGQGNLLSGDLVSGLIQVCLPLLVMGIEPQKTGIQPLSFLRQFPGLRLQGLAGQGQLLPPLLTLDQIVFLSAQFLGQAIPGQAGSLLLGS